MKSKHGVAFSFMKEIIANYKNKSSKSKARKCLIWPFHKNRGYGRIWVPELKKEKYVHYLICCAVHGKPPKNKPHALHNCDCGHLGCVEPSHLEWGSKSKDAGPDKIRAGTSNNGERSGACKLKTKEVIKIRKLYETGDFSYRDLGEMFGVSNVHIGHIINYKYRKIA